MKSVQSATSLPESPGTDRSHRMRNYAITMGIRMLCVLAIPFVHGWWMALCAAGAIILPYFAVVLANVTTNKPGEGAERQTVQTLQGQSAASLEEDGPVVITDQAKQEWVYYPPSDHTPGPHDQEDPHPDPTSPER
ncbi:DUF3099 domain-containing protein [Lysinibacter cavernae]|uniref:DUF3099 domain-containing protein n=1 Tax=Lysinibacter cavernae TaxID=1640652 RepID=A0A7X5QZD0_9MICO|nr:DUF3099 domain-containing protein [Lysinibacter cavernae]NIH52814.1 hypothetical protein [Lysinibacter cavernae]